MQMIGTFAVKYYVLILLSMCFSLIPVWGKTTPVGERILEENFENLIHLGVPAWCADSVKKKNLPSSVLKSIHLPTGWDIGWWGLDHATRIGAEKDFLRIQAVTPLTIYGAGIPQTYEQQDYIFRITMRMPSDASCKKSKIAVGSFRYGTVQYGEFWDRDVVLTRGERVTVDVPVRFPLTGVGFRGMFRVVGDVVFDKFEVYNGRKRELKKEGISVVEGVIVARSQLPDPAKSSYPDCRYTLHFKAMNILKGNPCPKEIQLIVEGFKKYKLFNTNNLKVGDFIRCNIVSFDSLPEEKKNIQQADDLSLFELDNYYSLDIEKIYGFSAIKSDIAFSGKQKYDSIFELQINSALTEKMKKDQASAISSELQRINQMLKEYPAEKYAEYNKKFTAVWTAEKQKDPPEYNRLERIDSGKKYRYVWRNIDNSFWTLPEHHQLIGTIPRLQRQNIKALQSLQKFFNANGCQFMVCVIPNFFNIASRVINRDFRAVPDFVSAFVVRDFLQNGIETFYFADSIISNYNRYPWAYFYPYDDHPSDTTQDVLTDILSRRLGRYDLPKVLDKNRFSEDQAAHVYGESPQYLFPFNCDIGKNTAGKSYKCRRILYDKKEIFPNPDSAVLLLGNSFLQTPMGAPDSVPSLLTQKLSAPVMSYRISGNAIADSGFTNIFHNPEFYLKNKKIIIFVMSVDYIYRVNFVNADHYDSMMKLLSEYGLVGEMQIKEGNFTDKSYSKLLPNSAFFKIPASGKVRIRKNIADQKINYSKAMALQLSACAFGRDPVIGMVNGEKIELREMEFYHKLDKVMVKLPKAVKELEIELTGKPGTVIAFGNIQLYQ